MDEGVAVNLVVMRQWYTPESTIGEMFVDGQRECFTLEDAVRDHKIPGKTAIPEGTYRTVLTHSQRFKRELPLLVDVPGFSGVRIHSGNTPDDTEGCILVGQTRMDNFVGRSRAAFDQLFAKMQVAKRAGLDITITIEDGRA